MTSYTYASLETAVVAALVQAQSPYTAIPPDFAELFPDATSYAEGRIARDLVLLNTRAQRGGATTASSQAFLLSSLTAPAGLDQPILVVEGVSLTVSGAAYEYDKVSLDTINLLWPQSSLTLAPNAADWIGRWWAMENDTTILLAPTPDAIYPITVTGLFLQTPLSSSNTITYISKVYGDLMFCAVMLFMSGALLRNYGAQADEPRMAQSWKGQYHNLLPGCESEEARRRGLTVDDLRAMRGAPQQAAGQQAA